MSSHNKNVLVGFEDSDDAGVFQLTSDLGLVQTLDFITPVVDDPYIYGEIAAANALSDVFAMGGDVKTALNIVGFDNIHHDYKVLQEILKGGKSKIKECGGMLVGGHTINSLEMYYGLSVTGVVHPNNIYTNNSAKIGDVLVLTKPLGMGILSTALKEDLLDEKTIIHISSIMKSLNYKASILMRKYQTHACTDITGFGLLGHSYESIREEISIHIDSSCVPYIQEAFILAQQDIIPAGSKKNRAYLKDKIKFEKKLPLALELILCDAQTSGGLLVSMNSDDAKEFIKDMQDFSQGYASIIGEVKPRGEKELIIW